MGSIRRYKSPNKFFDGSKLNVPGQGIKTVERSPNDNVPLKSQVGRISRPPIPSSTPKPTPTPTPSPTPLPGNKIYQTGDNFIFMTGDYYIFQNQ